ncbi:hypothetical protein D3C78_1424820 [compost metagenome]
MFRAVPAGDQLQRVLLRLFLQRLEQRHQQLGVGVVFGGEVPGILDLLRQLRVMQQGAQGAQGGRFDAGPAARRHDGWRLAALPGFLAFPVVAVLPLALALAALPVVALARITALFRIGRCKVRRRHVTGRRCG